MDSTDANSGIFIRCEDPKKPGAKICYECNIFDTWPDPSYGTGAIVYHAEVNPMTGGKNGGFGQGPRSCPRLKGNSVGRVNPTRGSRV